MRACLVLVLALAAGQGDPAVIVHLRDGGFVRALALPERDGDRAVLRLYPGGMLATLPAQRVDFEATRRAWEAARAAPPPEPPPRASGTVSGGRASPASLPSPAAAPSPGEVAPTETPAPDERPSRLELSAEFTRLTLVRQALEDEVEALEKERDELEREIRRYASHSQVAAGLGKMLKAVKDRLDLQSEALERVGRELAAVLREAATRGFRLRRLSTGP